MGIHLVHERMAELWTIQKHQRSLTKAELDEVSMCLDANANYIFELSKLHNLSLIASETNDYDWQYKICAEMEQLQQPQ